MSTSERSRAGVDRFCSGCGSPVHPLAVLCVKCGCKLQRTGDMVMKKPTSGGILAAMGVGTVILPLVGLGAAVYLACRREFSLAGAMVALAGIAWLGWVLVYSGL